MKRKIKNIYLIFCFLFSSVTVGVCQFNSIYTAPTNITVSGTLTLSNNMLYGYTWYNYGHIYSINVNGTGYKDLFAFSGTDGDIPTGLLTLSVTGDSLFGMTSIGGASFNTLTQITGYGCVFSIKTDGSGYYKIHDFNDTNGYGPELGGVIFSRNILYGMTYFGGAYNDGVIFSVHADGSGYRDILDFDSINGAHPQGSLTFSVTGDTLYGMTQIGGANNNGCIFAIRTDGTSYHRLFDFSISNSNGGSPLGNLTLSRNVFYGMTGGNNAYQGCVFSINSDGTGYRDLLNFNDTNGAFPFGSIIIENNKLYGMIMQGGVNSGGVFFDIGTNGNTYQDLHDFSCATDKGSHPTGSITSSLTGDTLYGVTGGDYCNSGNNGFIFNYTSNTVGIKEIDPKNTVNVFPNPSNGIFTIKYSGIENRPSVAIYNMLGENVYSAQLNTATSQIDLGNNPLGVYLYRIINQDGNLLESGKLVKEQ